MPTTRETSTLNIKPTSINALNNVPLSVTTQGCSAYIDLADTNRWGSFVWGDGTTWGITTEYSIGQKMPPASTVVI